MDVNGVISATNGNSISWNSAYDWGDHAAQGYLANLSGHLSFELDDIPMLVNAINGQQATVGASYITSNI